MTNSYDILIVGGGLIGATFACALAKKPLKIAIVDAAIKTPTENDPQKDVRSIALSYISRRIFEGLGLWSKIEKRATPIPQIHISDKGHFGFAKIKAEEERVPALGYVVEIEDLNQILESELNKFSNIAKLPLRKLNELGIAKNAVKLSFNDNKEEFTTKLLVAADGGNSTIRKLLKIDTYTYDYQQSALVTNIGLMTDHQNIAFERFTEEGPLAFLPLGEKRYAVVWTLSTEKASRLLAFEDQAFLKELHNEFGSRLGKFVWVGARQTFPLQLSYAKKNIHPHVVLMGNACHTLHPVAGQGFNLGLRDVAELAQLISDYLANARSFTDPALLHDYARARQNDQNSMINFTHSLVQVFSNKKPILPLFRDMGLCGLDLLPPIKHVFARKTMGFHGKLSRLALGLSL